MIKLFVTDLDGTLLKENLYIEKKDQEALRFLANNETEIAFATGRTDHEIVRFFQDIGISGHRISQNGAFVVDKNNQTISRNQFTNDVNQMLYEGIKNSPTYYFVSTEDEIFYQQDIPIIDQLQPVFHNRLVHNPQLMEQIEKNLPVAKFMLLGEKDQLIKIQSEIDTQLSGQVNSFLSTPLCLDIMPVGVNKRAGINHLLETLAIEPNEIAVIGDSYNDIDMLKMTPHSYAMEIADPEVKAVAQHVVSHVHQAIDDLRLKKSL